jgi:hypothetical protein
VTPMRLSVQGRPGWSTISAGPLHVLLRGEGTEVAARVRAAAASGDLDDVLDHIVRGGLRQLPDFVAATEGERVRVVARGTAYAVVAGPAGTGEIRASVREPWRDEEAPAGAERVELRTGDPEPVEQAALTEPPAQEPAGWRLPARLSRPQTAAAPGPAAAAGTVPDEVDELPSYDHLFGATQHGSPRYIEPHDSGALAELPIGEAPIEAAGGFSPAVPQADRTLPPPADTGRAAAEPGTVPATEQHVPLPPPGGGLIDSVPWRSGGSNVPAADPPLAAPRPVQADDAGAMPAPAAPVPAVEADAGRRMPSAEPQDPDDEGDAEATVNRSALLAAQVRPGPRVLAVLCPAGHHSPPHAGLCRVCGREIPSQQPFQTTRPVLGLLRLSTGDVVPLDRGVLLGRSPRVKPELPVAERPHLVRVASPENDISRNHVEVVLDGWHVLARDLGSTNGTMVALPGQPAVRLRPGDQQVIEPGTVVSLADEVTFTFEVAV